MFRIFHQPSPLRTGLQHGLVVSSSVGLFLLVFLTVFEPFGLSDVDAIPRLYLIVGYAVTSFILLLANLTLVPPMLPRIFREEAWILPKKILWQLWLVFLVGTGCFLFNALFHLVYDEPCLTLSRFLYFQYLALTIGIFPIVIYNLVTHIVWLKHNFRQAQEMSIQLKTQGTIPYRRSKVGAKVILTSEGGRETHELDPYDIIYAASEGNYTNIFVETNGTKRVFIRGSLKMVERQLASYPFLLRCHRAYIVNVRKVRDIAGNAQGLRLALKKAEKTVPVARGQVKEFRSRLRTHSFPSD